MERAGSWKCLLSLIRRDQKYEDWFYVYLQVMKLFAKDPLKSFYRTFHSQFLLSLFPFLTLLLSVSSFSVSQCLSLSVSLLEICERSEENVQFLLQFFFSFSFGLSRLTNNHEINVCGQKSIHSIGCVWEWPILSVIDPFIGEINRKELLYSHRPIRISDLEIAPAILLYFIKRIRTFSKIQLRTAEKLPPLHSDRK